MHFISYYFYYGDYMLNKELEKQIRCKCGQLWGMHNHKRRHKRCKTKVIARGEHGKNETAND